MFAGSVAEEGVCRKDRPRGCVGERGGESMPPRQYPRLGAVRVRGHACMHACGGGGAVCAKLVEDACRTGRGTSQAGAARGRGAVACGGRGGHTYQ